MSSFRKGVAEQAPEDWIASAVCARGSEDGPSRLPGGADLRTLVSELPGELLGPDHVARWGAELGILVKLLDPGARIPVHCHPSRDFARAYLRSALGKAEASVVLAAPYGVATSYVGFEDAIEFDELCALVAGDRTHELLARMRTVDLRPRDTLFIPAGVPHALASGTLVIEVQEATDLSILLEGPERGRGNKDPEQRLELPDAMLAVNRDGWSEDELERLVTRATAVPDDPVTSLVPANAAPFFGLELVRAASSPSFPAQCAVLIVTAGDAVIEWGDEGAHTTLALGDAALVPFAAGPTTIRGDTELVRCTPANRALKAFE